MVYGTVGRAILEVVLSIKFKGGWVIHERALTYPEANLYLDFDMGPRRVITFPKFGKGIFT
jgi:predicted solute-binding protein